jgi:hypothetical protein
MGKKSKKIKGTVGMAQRVALQMKIEWHFPEELRGTFANHMVIQRDENEVFLSFFEVQPPVITDPKEAVQKSGKLQTIRATCVAKIVISSARFATFANTMQSIEPASIEVQASPDGPPAEKSITKNGKKE